MAEAVPARCCRNTTSRTRRKSLGVYIRLARAGVQMAEAVPDSLLPEYDIEDAEENPELRLGRYAREHLVVRDREQDFYDDDDLY